MKAAPTPVWGFSGAGWEAEDVRSFRFGSGVGLEVVGGVELKVDTREDGVRRCRENSGAAGVGWQVEDGIRCRLYSGEAEADSRDGLRCWLAAGAGGGVS